MSTFYSNVDIKGILTMNSTQIQSLAAGSASGHAVEYDQMNSAISAALVGGMEYKGSYNPATNTPDLTAAAVSKGDFYLISADGSVDTTAFNAGDHIVFSADVGAAVAPDDADFDKVDNTEAGASLAGLSDVGLDAAAAGDFLGYNGSEWTDYAFGEGFDLVHTDGSEAVSVKLDGATLAKSASGLKVNSITLAEVSDSGSLAALSELPLSDIEDIADDRILGNVSGVAAAPAELTAAQVRTLINVEDGATADQTGAEIKAAYEAEADTNAFDDAAVSKLSGIESGATADQTGAEIKAAYEAEADTNAFTDADHSKLDGIAAGAEVNRGVHSALIGSTTSEVVTHNFALTDFKAVQVNMYDASSGEQVFGSGITFATNSLTVSFIEAPGASAVKIVVSVAE